ncbi:MAG: hypothetical protein K1X83_07405 [Oligoflexia bacterium]|nr:hypothetical protein [Oligoflexia bacterium]
MVYISNIKKLAIAAMIALTACSETATISDYSEAIAGGAAGTAVGAGTGALIGSIIANGDIAKSALVGGAVGLAAGIAAGAIYKSYQTSATISANESQITENHAAIVANQEDILNVRESLTAESAAMDVDPASAEYIYTGATLGQYNR